MRRIAWNLRQLIEAVAKGLGIEGAALIVGTALVAYCAALFDSRLAYGVVGLALLVVAYATALPPKPRA